MQVSGPSLGGALKMRACPMFPPIVALAGLATAAPSPAQTGATDERLSCLFRREPTGFNKDGVFRLLNR